MTRQPPRLLVKTLAVVFVTVALLLGAVFIVVTVTVRDQVRQSVTANLESGQRIFSAVERRRQRELQTQAATLAENPTLKAAIDTYAAETRGGNDTRRSEWLATIANELDKVAARIDSDVVVLADPVSTRWPRPDASPIGGPSAGPSLCRAIAAARASTASSRPAA